MATENDVVLIYLEDQPISFARIEGFTPDAKPGWFHVTLLMLQIPLQTVTWILRDAYINGDEFTMGGRRMRLELVEAPVEEAIDDTQDDTGTSAETETEKPASKNGSNVISLADLKRK